MKRRHVLGGLASVGVVGLSGCLSGSEQDMELFSSRPYPQVFNKYYELLGERSIAFELKLDGFFSGRTELSLVEDPERPRNGVLNEGWKEHVEKFTTEWIDESSISSDDLVNEYSVYFDSEYDRSVTRYNLTNGFWMLGAITKNLSSDSGVGYTFDRNVDSSRTLVSGYSLVDSLDDFVKIGTEEYNGFTADVFHSIPFSRESDETSGVVHLADVDGVYIPIFADLEIEGHGYKFRMTDIDEVSEPNWVNEYYDKTGHVVSGIKYHYDPSSYTDGLALDLTPHPYSNLDIIYERPNGEEYTVENIVAGRGHGLYLSENPKEIIFGNSDEDRDYTQFEEGGEFRIYRHGTDELLEEFVLFWYKEDQLQDKLDKYDAWDQVLEKTEYNSKEDVPDDILREVIMNSESQSHCGWGYRDVIDYDVLVKEDTIELQIFGTTSGNDELHIEYGDQEHMIDYVLGLARDGYGPSNPYVVEFSKEEGVNEIILNGSKAIPLQYYD